jgi:hypothetical protein
MALLQIKMMMEAGFTTDEIAAYFNVSEQFILKVIKVYEMCPPSD